MGALACTADREPASEFVVHNQPPGAWSRDRAWRLVEQKRIGTVDGDGPDAFGRIVGVALDPLGRVWIADGQQHQLRVFDAEGRHVRSVGHKGAGPAEFREIAGMDWGPDGNLWVLDAGNARFAVYDTAGKLVATRSRNAMVTETPWPGGFDAQGRLYDLSSRHTEKNVEKTSLVRAEIDGETADTLWLPDFETRSFGRISRTVGTEIRVNEAPVPFIADQRWAVDPRGHVWFAMTDRYRIQRLSAAGTPDRIIELENPSRRVTREEEARILRNYEWFERQGGRLDPSLIPDTHPQLFSFFFDDAGHLWVAPTYDVRQNTPLDVFDADGRYLGRVMGPQRLFATPIPAIRGDRMAAVIGSDDGVHSVGLFRIEKPAR